MYQLCKNIIDNTYESFIRVFKWMESFKIYRTIKGKLFVTGSIFHFYLKRLTGSYLLFLLPSKNYKLYNLRRSYRQRLQQEVEPVYVVTRHDHPRLLIFFLLLWLWSNWNWLNRPRRGVISQMNLIWTNNQFLKKVSASVIIVSYRWKIISKTTLFVVLWIKFLFLHFSFL